MSSTQVLTHFNPKHPINLSYYASNTGIDAVLAHRFPDNVKNPISYTSRALSSSEKTIQQSIKNTLAIFWGVTKLYLFLFGRQFIIKSNNRPLLTRFSQKKAIPKMAFGRVQKWAFLLAIFYYKIECNIGAENIVADSWSRLMLDTTDNFISNEISDIVNWVEEYLLIVFSEFELKLWKIVFNEKTLLTF